MKWYYKNGVATKGHSTIFGYRRRNVFIILAVVAFLLALIIGLAVGLTLRNRHSTLSPFNKKVTNRSQDLPLPDDTGGIYSGDLTYYAPGLGACGVTSTATDMICAISWQLYGNVPYSSDSANQQTRPKWGQILILIRFVFAKFERRGIVTGLQGM
jgi:hypothetical protein